MTLMALLAIILLISCVQQEQMCESVVEVGPDPHLSSNNMDVYVVELLRHQRKTVPTDYGQPSRKSRVGPEVFQRFQTSQV